jgi:uncharacterized protein YycO
MTVRVIFSRRRNLGSVALRTVMWSPWSHCGVIDGDFVIQAVANPFGKSEVIYTHLEHFKAESARWAIVEFEADERRTCEAARSQIGKPYDWLGVAGIGFHRDWSDDTSWFCSELVAWALEQGGCDLFRIGAKRITPQHLWMLERPILLAA